MKPLLLFVGVAIGTYLTMKLLWTREPDRAGSRPFLAALTPTTPALDAERLLEEAAAVLTSRGGYGWTDALALIEKARAALTPTTPPLDVDDEDGAPFPEHVLDGDCWCDPTIEAIYGRNHPATAGGRWEVSGLGGVRRAAALTPTTPPLDAERHPVAMLDLATLTYVRESIEGIQHVGGTVVPLALIDSIISVRAEVRGEPDSATSGQAYLRDLGGRVDAFVDPLAVSSPRPRTGHTHRRQWCERNESSASAHGHNDGCYRDVPCYNTACAPTLPPRSPLPMEVRDDHP